MFEPYFDRIASRATGDAHLAEVRRARREFQDLTGKFDENEPCFEERMTLFLEWFVLDRPGRDGLIPVERFLVDERLELSEGELSAFEGLAATQRTLARLDRWLEGRIHLTDMIGGGAWSVRQNLPMVGLQRGDLLDVRFVPFRGDLYLGRGMVFHPRIASTAILRFLETAHRLGKLRFDLINVLAGHRLRFDRYRNIRVGHIYRFPPQ